MSNNGRRNTNSRRTEPGEEERKTNSRRTEPVEEENTTEINPNVRRLLNGHGDWIVDYAHFELVQGMQGFRRLRELTLRNLITHIRSNRGRILVGYIIYEYADVYRKVYLSYRDNTLTISFSNWNASSLGIMARTDPDMDSVICMHERRLILYTGSNPLTIHQLNAFLLMATYISPRFEEYTDLLLYSMNEIFQSTAEMLENHGYTNLETILSSGHPLLKSLGHLLDFMQFNDANTGGPQNDSLFSLLGDGVMGIRRRMLTDIFTAQQLNRQSSDREISRYSPERRLNFTTRLCEYIVYAYSRFSQRNGFPRVRGRVEMSGQLHLLISFCEWHHTYLRDWSFEYCKCFVSIFIHFVIRPLEEYGSNDGNDDDDSDDYDGNLRRITRRRIPEAEDDDVELIFALPPHAGPESGKSHPRSDRRRRR